MIDNLIKILHIIIIWQSFFFGIVLLHSKFRKKKSNVFLALILLVIGVQFSLLQSASEKQLGTLLNSTLNMGFLYGPLLFLYVRSLLRVDDLFMKYDWLHFIPTLVIFISLVELDAVVILVFDYARLTSILTYNILGIIEIYRYRKAIIQISSRIIGTEELNWLITLLIITIYNAVMSVFSVIFQQFFLQVLVLFGVFAFVQLILYLGVKRPSYFRKLSKSDFEITHSTDSAKENTSSSYSITDLELLANRVNGYVEKTEIYKNSDLDISTLAANLEVHPKMLSQSLNKVLKKNFSEYINSYRIEESKELLKTASSNNLNIKDVMYDVGFTSRSVFNTLFKKRTGMTPSEYRNEFN